MTTARRRPGPVDLQGPHPDMGDLFTRCHIDSLLTNIAEDHTLVSAEAF